MKEKWKEKIHDRCRGMAEVLGLFIKWVVISVLIGVSVGLVGTAFYYGMQWATQFRREYPVIILGLPLAGIFILWTYHMMGRDNDKGTNTVLSAIRAEEEIPICMAPLIFISTLLTHLFGGSAGREGAALQLGGSMANWLGKRLHMSSKEINVIIMCGMAAAFSSLFGTPMAAAFFAMEVVSVGIMHYAALVPCVFASLIASGVSHMLGARGESFTILKIPEFGLIPAVKILILAALCAGVSICFCVALHRASALGKKYIQNKYVRIALAGVIILGLAALFRTTDYLGAGMDVIERSVAGEARPEAFALKILFTAVTLGAGFKGGEIVPSFFVGATFGCVMGQLLGISSSMCAAIGMTAVFCGVTNSPVSSILIALELFGMEAMPYFLIAVAVSYMLSGYYGLYHSQKIVYSKYKTEYLDRICQ